MKKSFLGFSLAVVASAAMSTMSLAAPPGGTGAINPLDLEGNGGYHVRLPVDTVHAPITLASEEVGIAPVVLASSDEPMITVIVGLEGTAVITGDGGTTVDLHGDEGVVLETLSVGIDEVTHEKVAGIQGVGIITGDEFGKKPLVIEGARDDVIRGTQEGWDIKKYPEGWSPSAILASYPYDWRDGPPSSGTQEVSLRGTQEFSPIVLATVLMGGLETKQSVFEKPGI